MHTMFRIYISVPTVNKWMEVQRSKLTPSFMLIIEGRPRILTVNPVSVSWDVGGVWGGVPLQVRVVVLR